MIINNPCIITARLLPGIKIDTAFISIDIAGYQSERAVYQVYIDLPGYTYDSKNLRSGASDRSLQSGLESLLSFLSAFAESRQSGDPESENWDLFPDKLADFATQNSEEISMMCMELEETPNCIRN